MGKHRKDGPGRVYIKCGNCNGKGYIVVNKQNVKCGVCDGKGHIG